MWAAGRLMSSLTFGARPFNTAYAGSETASGLLTLGEAGKPEVEHLVEEWLVQQASLTLPDSGGLVRPLAHGRFLVGLLVVERDEGAGPPALDYMPDGAPRVLDPTDPPARGGRGGSRGDGATGRLGCMPDFARSILDLTAL